MRHIGFLLLVYVLLIHTPLTSAKNIKIRSSQECRQLGFLKNDIKCRDCHPLLQYTGSVELQQECLSCCSSDEEEAPARIYTSARLELRGIHFELEEPRSEFGMFYREYKKKFENRLKIVDKPTAFWPRLILEDKKSGEETEMSLVGWTKDSLHDYLVQALGMDKSK